MHKGYYRERQKKLVYTSIANLKWYISLTNKIMNFCSCFQLISECCDLDKGTKRSDISHSVFIFICRNMNNKMAVGN